MKTTEMKEHFKLIMLGLFLCSTCFTADAQIAPKLKIIKDSPTTAQINWTNQVGTSYRLWLTESLAPSAWTPWADAFSEDTNVVVSISTVEAPTAFFRVQIPTNGTLPAVQIFSPTNDQTVSGEIAVSVGAQITNQLQGANLYLDDALVGFIDSGGIRFYLDTSHFANGSHTLYAGAVDTANNEILSSTITVDFDNPVRWLNACSMFNSFVPIDVESDIYPADWLVSVMDTNGTIVRTITGSTTDGIIQTSWDGTDDNSQPLPIESLYQITVDVIETSGSSMMMAPSLATSSDSTMAASKTNRYGVMEYEFEEPDVNPLTAYLEVLKIYEQLSEKERSIYPPLPPEPTNNPNVTAKKKLNVREMFYASHPTSGNDTIAMSSATTATPNASSSMASGSTKALVWWENPWSSKQTIVARVPIPGGFGNTVANNCNQIATLIGTADGTVGNNRGVFGTYVQVVSTSSEVYDLTNQFVNQNVTAFYFYGHGNTNGNVFGTTTAGISAKSLANLFGNYFYPSLNSTWGRFAGKPGMLTQKAFNFVFLDGCNTGLGNFPEAFGIPKAISGAALNEAGLHKRAFMGWTGPVTFQFDSAHIDWTLKFWSTWLDGDAYDTTLIQAKEAADAYRPSVLSDVPIKWYGNGSLKWSD